MNKNTKFTNPMKVITGPNTRWSYANVWEPKSINGGTPKFSVSLIIPKSDTKTVAKIQAAIEAAYPEYITKDQMYRICHISKKTCLFLLESGLVPNIDSGKKTRRFKIKTVDVIQYLKDRDDYVWIYSQLMLQIVLMLQLVALPL